jgi:hypothetical protein
MTALRNQHVRGKVSVFIASLALVVGASLGQFGAQAYQLSDLNSVATINGSGANAGMNSWSVEGQNQLASQWFYYRTGSVNANAPISSLGLLSETQSDARTLSLTYGNTQSPFTVEVDYTMKGGAFGSGTADIGEMITIQNNGSSALDFHFFQYCNFVLGGPGIANDLQIVKNPATGKSFLAEQTSSGVALNELADAETVVVPGAVRAEADTGNNTLTRILGGAYNLNNNLGPMNGDVTWAFQWDMSIAQGSTYIISKDLNITGVALVPEPATLGLISLGLVALGFRRRSRSR